MRLHIGAMALATAMALSNASPARAVSIPIDYTISASAGGKTFALGTLTLDYDGSAYTLESLFLTLPDKSSFVTSYVTLSPVPGTSDYCLYSLTTCSVVPEKNSLYVIFDPSLTSQTDTLYGYSTKELVTQSLSVTIQQAAVPEPATWAMMFLGFAVLGVSMQFRRRRTVPLQT